MKIESDPLALREIERAFLQIFYPVTDNYGCYLSSLAAEEQRGWRWQANGLFTPFSPLVERREFISRAKGDIELSRTKYGRSFSHYDLRPDYIDALEKVLEARGERTVIRVSLLGPEYLPEYLYPFVYDVTMTEDRSLSLPDDMDWMVNNAIFSKAGDWGALSADGYFWVVGG